MKSAPYSVSTVLRWRRLRISIRSVSSRPTVPIERSAIALVRGARTDVRRMGMDSLANMASTVSANMLSWSLINNVNGAARDPELKCLRLEPEPS